MKRSSWTNKVYSYLVAANRWYLETPERSLDEAYKAALAIKAMEDEYFNGKRIAPGGTHGDSAMSYFHSELKKYLRIVRMRLTEFKVSRPWFSSSNQTITKLAKNDGTAATKDAFAIQTRNNPSLILEKLRFIDEVLAKYADRDEYLSYSVRRPQIVTGPPTVIKQSQLSVNQAENKISNASSDNKSTSDALPRSILNTINRLQVELDPKAEEVVVENFRKSQRKTVIAVRMILLLMVVPLLTHLLAKQIIVGPVVDHVRERNEQVLFLNSEMEERALGELQTFEERLKFQNLMSQAARLSPEEIENNLKEKAQELAEEFRSESANAIKNVFADLLALIAFGLLIVASRREIAVLKDFMDRIVYGLSDSAKAFIIILFTDIFVGFHSPHGWEVLLSNVSRHLGLPENHDFIFLFIATFPVILDTIFKYWIFRYLNRVSPSAVATYRNMNE